MSNSSSRRSAPESPNERSEVIREEDNNNASLELSDTEKRDLLRAKEAKENLHLARAHAYSAEEYTFMQKSLGMGRKTKFEARNIKKLKASYDLIQHVVDKGYFHLTTHYSESPQEIKQRKIDFARYEELESESRKYMARPYKITVEMQNLNKKLKEKEFKPIGSTIQLLPLTNLQLMWPLACIPQSIKQDFPSIILAPMRIIISLEHPFFQLFYVVNREYSKAVPEFRQKEVGEKPAVNKDVFFKTRGIISKDSAKRNKYKNVTRQTVLANPVPIDRAEEAIAAEPRFTALKATENVKRKFFERFGGDKELEMNSYQFIVNYELLGHSYLRVSEKFLVLILMAASLDDKPRKKALHRLLNFLVFLHCKNDCVVLKAVPRGPKKQKAPAK